MLNLTNNTRYANKVNKFKGWNIYDWLCLHYPLYLQCRRQGLSMKRQKWYHNNTLAYESFKYSIRIKHESGIFKENYFFAKLVGLYHCVCLSSIIHSQWPASRPFLGHFISNRSTVLNVYSYYRGLNKRLMLCRGFQNVH